MAQSQAVPLIVVDGPARSGKATFSKGVARRLGFHHIDSGLLYRAVGVISHERGVDPLSIAITLSAPDCERDDLRSDAASEAASKVAQNPTVRKIINARLLELLAEPPGTVMDGRAGAYEFPEATLKIFLWAHPRACADRHVAWLKSQGKEPDPYAILDDINRRNRQDLERAVSPLRYDSNKYHHRINCTSMGIEEMIEYGLKVCAEHGMVPVAECAV